MKAKTSQPDSGTMSAAGSPSIASYAKALRRILRDELGAVEEELVERNGISGLASVPRDALARAISTVLGLPREDSLLLLPTESGPIDYRPWASGIESRMG